MTWNLFGQYLAVLLASLLVWRMWRLGLLFEYRAFLAFIFFESFSSIIYLVHRSLWMHGIKVFDYRVLWAFIQIMIWITTLWMVYALLTGILKQLPGIFKFSLRLLNIIFGISVVLALFTVRPEYTASNGVRNSDWVASATILILDLDRALAFAELLTILAILTFVLFFPVRVSRNRAAFSAGLSIYLCLRIALLLERSYLPMLFKAFSLDFAPFVLSGCILYWFFSIGKTGEEQQATLGRGWQAVPRDHLVRQLEAMNAALLRSREQS